MKKITELKTEEKKLRTLTYALTGLILVIMVVCIYSTVKNSIDFISFLPVFFLPMLLVNVFKIRKLTKEIKTRE
jgi:hypothetical protein